MSRLFVPLDVDFQQDPKILAAGPWAELAYVRALALCKRLLTDGFVSRSQLRFLCDGLTLADTGNPENPTSDEIAAMLVDCGLWSEADGGWYIVAWSWHNESRDKIDEVRERKRSAGIAGNHAKWHVARGKTDPKCDLCSQIIAGATDHVSQVRDRCESQTIAEDREPDSPEVETEVETEPKSETETTAAIAVAIDPSFQAFWHVYPRKDHKPAALKEFEKARKRADAGVIADAALRYRDDPNRSAEFTKHASTWLHNDCWDDPPLPPRNGTNGRTSALDAALRAEVGHAAN